MHRRLRARAGAFRLRHDPALYRAPFVAAALTLCATYALTAVRRFDEGGIGIFLDGTILYRVALRGAERGGLGLEAIQHVWIARAIEAGFPVVTLFELLSPLAVFHRGFRRAWLVVLLAFHLAVSSLMMISFRGNIVLMALFLTDLPHSPAPGSRSGPARRRPVRPPTHLLSGLHAGRHGGGHREARG